MVAIRFTNGANCIKSQGVSLSTGHIFTPPKKHKVYFKNNRRLWPHCSEQKELNVLCSDSRFVSDLCSVYPFQATKLVRLRASLTRPLLADPDLDARVLVLVRDPRGTMASRLKWGFCKHNPKNCYYADVLCGDLAADYHAIEKLSKEFPGRVAAVRYEDVAADPERQAEEMLRFFGAPMHPSVLEFVRSHTNPKNATDIRFYSTYRDSQKAPYVWRERLDFETVRSVQEACWKAMELWGYANYSSEADVMRNHPVLPFAKFSLTPEKLQL